MGEAVAAQGAPASRSAILTSRGRVLTELPGDLLAGAVAVHRADLQGVLAQAAGEVPLGVEVTSVGRRATRSSPARPTAPNTAATC